LLLLSRGQINRNLLRQARYFEKDTEAVALGYDISYWTGGAAFANVSPL
jgi:hypothetical protein